MTGLPYSRAYIDYTANRSQIIELLRADPLARQTAFVPSRRQRQLANAIYGGAVVLLSSQLENYFESLVGESFDAINAAALLVSAIPESLRMLHVNHLLRQAHNEGDRAKRIVTIKLLLTSNYLNDSEQCGKLNSQVLIEEFSNPSTEKIKKLFKCFEVDVISEALKLDNRPDRRSIITAKVDEMVDKRNSIAHTGSATLTRQDVSDYLYYSRRFARNVDRVIGRAVGNIVEKWPWTKADF